MAMHPWTCQLLADCLGMTLEQAAKALAVLEAIELVNPDHLARWERAAAVYHLRGRGLKPSALAERFSLDRATVFRLLAIHARRKRQGLKASA